MLYKLCFATITAGLVLGMVRTNAAQAFAAPVRIQDAGDPATEKPAPAEEPKEADMKKPDALHPHIKLETTLGDIVIELDGEKTPITANNFVTYVKDGFYNGTVFHRVIKTFMIQGGGFLPSMERKTDGILEPIPLETGTGLSNARGTIAMARTGNPNSATCQFFINVVDNQRLDYTSDRSPGYAVFGKVIEGMDVVDMIRDTKLTKHPKYPAPQAVTPEEPVIIKTATVLGEFDGEALAEKAAIAVEERENAGEKALSDFIKKAEADAGAKAVKTDSGLMYIELKEGDGATPDKNAKVTVHYTGWLLNGTKFDSSVDRGKPFSFSLKGGVIKGWLEGVASMKVGGKRKLIIPPELGYGDRGSPPVIPAGATLVFDVELLSVGG